MDSVDVARVGAATLKAAKVAITAKEFASFYENALDVALELRD